MLLPNWSAVFNKSEQNVCPRSRFKRQIKGIEISQGGGPVSTRQNPRLRVLKILSGPAAVGFTGNLCGLTLPETVHD
jgi:hypothetical protein